MPNWAGGMPAAHRMENDPGGTAVPTTIQVSTSWNRPAASAC